ncbi:MAG: AraC family transcriptional regulator [Polyangiales bacterium]
MATERSRARYEGTASITVLHPIFACARAEGVDVDALVEDLGITPAARDDPDHRIPDAIHERAWRECVARTGDELFGFHVVQSAEVGVYDALDYAMWSSATLHDVLGRMVRFQRMLCDAVEVALEIREGTTFFRRTTEAHGRHSVEFHLALAVRRARELTGRPIVPREVCFAHAAPKDIAPLAAFFRCPVRFASVESMLVLDAHDLALPVSSAKPGLAAVLDRHMSASLAHLPEVGSFLKRVRRAIADTLAHGHRPTLATTAHALKASPRTLQRRLLDDGTTHSEILDSIRRDLAARLLEERRMSVTETAFLLGFSDVSGFRRTYKRWTGRNPTGARSRRA